MNVDEHCMRTLNEWNLRHSQRGISKQNPLCFETTTTTKSKASMIYGIQLQLTVKLAECETCCQ